MRIAYLINQYPKVSHSFIRREIQALERQGMRIMRLALRGWDEPLADPDDVRERAETRYVLQSGIAALIGALLARLCASPLRVASAAGLALRIGAADGRPLYHLAYLAEACRAFPWVRAFGAEHVHAHFASNSAEVAMLLHALGGPAYSFTVHGTADFDGFDGVGIAEKVARAAFVVSVSSYGRAQLYRRMPHACWEKVHLVHCGLEPAFHAAALSSPPEAPRVVCVGRLSREKGQLLLVEAARRLVRRGVPLQLTLAGDGELRGEIERLVSRYQMAQHVRITGWIGSARVREEILRARALVLPSFSEGLPVVVMEAMALGRPVIATAVGGLHELVRHGEDGWLVPAGSVDALEGALQELFAAPAAQIERMARSARARALQRHSADTEAAKLVQLFGRSAAEASQLAAEARSSAHGARP